MKVTVPMPDGKIVSGEDVAIESSTERWSDITLKDGTIIRVKQAVAQIIRVDGQYDQEGNPLYVVKSSPAVAIIHVEPHMKQGQKGH